MVRNKPLQLANSPIAQEKEKTAYPRAKIMSLYAVDSGIPK